jgi:hypothetical protein
MDAAILFLHNVALWISILILTFLFTVIEHLITVNFKKRSHHREKTIQECLTRHQFSYFAFFIIALTTVDISPKSFLLFALIFAILLALCFWGVGLRRVYVQDDEIAGNHICPDHMCVGSLPRDFLKVNTVLAYVMGALALALICWLSYFGSP